MATRLTGFSKLVITLLILAAVFFGGRYLLNSTKFGQDIKKQADQAAAQNDNGSTCHANKRKGTRIIWR